MTTISRVVECIATVTRYPRQLLQPDADLENDLGIDSVMRAEILMALADEFQLALHSDEKNPAIRTIQHVSDWIATHIDASHMSNEFDDASSKPATPQQPVILPSKDANDVTGYVTGENTQQHEGLQSNLQPIPYPNAKGNSHSNGNENGMIQQHFSVPHRSSIPESTPNRRPVIPSFQQSQTAGAVDGRLQGRVALITGSGRGVGKTIARLLALKGATVIINSFHSREQGDQTVAEIQAVGGSAVHLWGSVTNADHVNNLFDQIGTQVGFLDILVCNASDGRLGSFLDLTPQDWDRAFQTNVSGHYHCAMRASELMKRRGGGSIVTLSSIAAHRYVQGMGCQGVVKAAVEAMTRNLACELAPFGIRTNCISGGPVYGDVMAQYPNARSTFNYWESIVPDGELCSPLDLANTVAFLVSDDARAVNGAIWTVDHGASTRAHSRSLPQPGKLTTSAM